MSVAERTKTAREFLLKYLADHPTVSKVDAARWLNNSRHEGVRLTLPYSEINRLFLQARLTQQQLNNPKVFNPPRLVTAKAQPLPPPPPKPIPIEVAAPGTLEPVTKFFIPGQAERKQYAETLALENPKVGSEWIRLEVKKKFGVGLDVRIIQAALETSRVLAGMKAKLRSPKSHEAPTATEETPAMPLPEPPPPPVKPDAMLREAAGVLKLLVDRMGWEKLAISVTHKGEITYDATPLPVLASKGSLTL